MALERSHRISASLKEVANAQFTPEEQAFIDQEVAKHRELMPDPAQFEGKPRVLYTIRDGKRERVESDIFQSSQVRNDLGKLGSTRSAFTDSDNARTADERAMFAKGKELSAFMEETLVSRCEFIFPAGAKIHRVSEFTDVRQGVDAVVEFPDPDSGQPQFLALDLTYADDKDEQIKKFSDCVRGVQKGTLANARYVQIREGEFAEIGLMPKIVVPFDNASVRSVVTGIAGIHDRPGVRLKPSAQSADFLEMARLQIQRQIEIAETVDQTKFMTYPPFTIENTPAGQDARKRDMLASLKSASAYLSQEPQKKSDKRDHSDKALATMRKIVDIGWDENEATILELAATEKAVANAADTAAGTDTMTGGAGTDSIAGGAGDDTIPAATGGGAAGGEPPKTPSDPPAPGSDPEPTLRAAAAAEDPAVLAAKWAELQAEIAKSRALEAQLAPIRAGTDRILSAPAPAPAPAPVDPAIEPAPRPTPDHTPTTEPAQHTPDAHPTPHSPDAHPTPDRHGAGHDAHPPGGHGHGHGHGDGHGHGEPWHLPRNASEAGYLIAAIGIGTWNVAKFFWQFVLHPIIHTTGYVISGDPKHPWKTFWDGFTGDLKKAFFGKSGGGGKSHGGGHGGGGHGGGGHGGGH